MSNTPPLKDQRLQIILTSEEVDKVIALAETNAGDNKSLMIRKMINAIYENPEDHGFYPPKKKA